MPGRLGKLRFLFIQPHWDRRYVEAFPTYEPLHGLLFGSLIKDLADTMIFDRRFDTDANLLQAVRDFEPDLVGITSHTGGEIPQIKYLLGLVKAERPQAVTIVGGQHPTLLPEDLFHHAVDLICVGPGEETIREVAEVIADRGDDFSLVNGIAIREGTNDYHFTPPRLFRSGCMDWPEFDYSLIPRKYQKHYGFIFEFRSNIYTVTTSGCPYRCKFCSLWSSARGTFRHRRPEDVARDIINQPQSYVHLTDDNTFFNEENALEIYEILKKANVKKKIMAYCRTDMIVKRSDLLEKWKEIGLGALVVGMEAVNDRNLEALNKRASLDVNIQAHRILEDLQIEDWAHFVIMPEFQKADFDEVWDFVDTNNITYPIFVAYTAVPGTPLFFEMKQKQRFSVYDYAYYNLQYMTLKTAMPKADWYSEFWGLYRKSASARTPWKRFRESPSFHLRPALGRAYVMGIRAPNRIQQFVDEQVEIERTVKYEEIEHTLLPSLRRDYKADKYYHSTSINDLKKSVPSMDLKQKVACA